MELYKAILEQNLEDVKRLLVEKPEIIDKRVECNVPLSFIAAKTGNLEIVKYIVEYYNPVKGDGK